MNSRKGSTPDWLTISCNVTLAYSNDVHIETYIFYGTTAPSGPRPVHCRGFTITLRHTTLGRTPLDEWSARRRDLYLTTNNTHKRQTSMPPGGIRTRNPSKRAAAVPRLRPRGHFDRPFLYIRRLFIYKKCTHLATYFFNCVVINLIYEWILNNWKDKQREVNT